MWPIRKSVFGIPTRDTVLDGNDGRLTEDLVIPQFRKTAPGWDGCRDRVDGRLDLKQELQCVYLFKYFTFLASNNWYVIVIFFRWVRPSQRKGHKGVFYEKEGIWLIYGGDAVARETVPSKSFSTPTKIEGDFWQYNISKNILIHIP